MRYLKEKFQLFKKWLKISFDDPDGKYKVHVVSRDTYEAIKLGSEYEGGVVIDGIYTRGDDYDLGDDEDYILITREKV